MMNIRTRRFFWFLLVLLSLIVVSGTYAQSGGSAKYFPETGHWVENEFLEKYLSAEDPLRLYGYPITDAYTDPQTGRLVQYFEKTRFELYPNNPPPLQVKTSTLGYYTYQPGMTLPAIPNMPGCKYFPETGHRVCYAFLDFFNQYGALEQFGYPLSDFEVHDGIIVQYFQKARMEWHPENPIGEQVVLTDLGRQYFEIHGENPDLLKPNQSIFSTHQKSVKQLKARTFVANPVTSLLGYQTFYIVVRDQTNSPVEGASITGTIQLPDGSTNKFQLQPTNNLGISVLKSIPLSSQQPGIAIATFEIGYQGITEITSTSFHIWY